MRGASCKLIEPLEEDGTLVRRGRELLEREIARFSVIEHDGVIIGCAALYPFRRRHARRARLRLQCDPITRRRRLRRAPRSKHYRSSGPGAQVEASS